MVGQMILKDLSSLTNLQAEATSPTYPKQQGPGKGQPKSQPPKQKFQKVPANAHHAPDRNPLKPTGSSNANAYKYAQNLNPPEDVVPRNAAKNGASENPEKNQPDAQLDNTEVSVTI